MKCTTHEPLNIVQILYSTSNKRYIFRREKMYTCIHDLEYRQGDDYVNSMWILQ